MRIFVGRWVGGWLRECVSGWVAESELVHECVRVSDSVKVKKWYFFYVAQYPVRWTAQSALHFTPWQT